EKVKLNTTLLGGGFGRRANPASDFVVEAVHVAKIVKAPVKVVWTREDDLAGGWYRPMWHDRFAAGLDSEGNPVAWTHTIVGQSITAGTAFEAYTIKDGVDSTSVEGAADLLYGIPNLQVDLHSPSNKVPVQWWRSVGHSHTGFSVRSEEHTSELQSHRDLHSFPTRRSSDLLYGIPNLQVDLHSPSNKVPVQWWRSVGHSHTGFSVRSEEHTSELQSHRDLHSFPTRRSSDLLYGIPNLQVDLHSPSNKVPVQWWRSVGHSHTGFSVRSEEHTSELQSHRDLHSFPTRRSSDLLYGIPNLQVDLHSPSNKVPVQWWRSVGHSHTGFSVEAFFDEVAHAGKKDPVELRRRLLAKEPRMLATLNLAAEKAGWGKPLPKGVGRGIATHFSFDSYVAQVV